MDERKEKIRKCKEFLQKRHLKLYEFILSLDHLQNTNSNQILNTQINQLKMQNEIMYKRLSEFVGDRIKEYKFSEIAVKGSILNRYLGIFPKHIDPFYKETIVPDLRGVGEFDQTKIKITGIIDCNQPGKSCFLQIQSGDKLILLSIGEFFYVGFKFKWDPVNIVKTSELLSHYSIEFILIVKRFYEEIMKDLRKRIESKGRNQIETPYEQRNNNNGNNNNHNNNNNMNSNNYNGTNNYISNNNFSNSNINNNNNIKNNLIRNNKTNLNDHNHVVPMGPENNITEENNHETVFPIVPHYCDTITTENFDFDPNQKNNGIHTPQSFNNIFEGGRSNDGLFYDTSSVFLDSDNFHTKIPEPEPLPESLRYIENEYVHSSNSQPFGFNLNSQDNSYYYNNIDQ